MSKKESIHANHRKRLKNRFLMHGEDSFEIHEVLELLLFYAIPRKNTNPVAHSLINKFGSIQCILDAPYNVLRNVYGVGDAVACFFKVILAVIRLYLVTISSYENGFYSREDLNDRLANKFVGRLEETVAIILLDAKCKIIYEGIISYGSYNSVDMNVRKVIELISNYNATAIAFAHNHPSGVALPSKDDIITTKKLKSLFDAMNITFIDHIIVADRDYVSFRDCNFPGIFDQEDDFIFSKKHDLDIKGKEEKKRKK